MIRLMIVDLVQALVQCLERSQGGSLELARLLGERQDRPADPAGASVAKLSGSTSKRRRRQPARSSPCSSRFSRLTVYLPGKASGPLRPPPPSLVVIVAPRGGSPPVTGR